ncbi:UDP-N-acetylmuramate--L-alanine ligase [Leptospira ognonensis]|uniref:UDP-N-acetylmuramate--L-alanine ligase n=1 Tax=Leptospira ognonensis TaxID=2484945 RepID=A0A4R9JZ30_9LEPT|nr:UDP-N-acetylmuramate--L-alanine ligase [Leptospira ognonensis]TGL57485.1 UDP-N-acetylmuramate--L-alanine ligase [Leptospira ognonensis]
MKFSILPGETGLLLGIGGSGMSSLAHILMDMGYTVYGYDKKESEVTIHLAERGAIIYPDLDSIDIKKINFVVFSSAINDKNHELFQEVSKLSIPMYHRSNVLHKIFSLKKSISVAGSHGKTSTTAMIAQILLEEEYDPTVMLGGDTSLFGKKGGKFGNEEWGVYESDESDGTFLQHKAEIRIITNVDNDHLDFYHSLDKLQHAFLQYISPTLAGVAIVQGQDSGIKFVLNHITSENNFDPNFKLYAIFPKSEISNTETAKLIQSLTNKLADKFQMIIYSIEEGGCRFQFLEKEFYLSLPFSGSHYLTNALCAVLGSNVVGVSPENSIKTLSRYVGVKRRQEVLGIKNQVKVIDDYGHHPTEIKTVINSLKQELVDGGTLIVLFQPHRYSRTSILQKELAAALDFADYLFLLPIYTAGENLIPGISAETIAKHLKLKNVKLLKGEPSLDIEVIENQTKSGDILLCIGAGNVRDWGIVFLNHTKT